MRTKQLLTLFFGCICCVQLGLAQQKKLVFVILDGIPAQDLERVATPNLDQVTQKGGYTRASTGGQTGGYSESPTISAIGYNSILTGTWANKHQVWGKWNRSPELPVLDDLPLPA